MTQNNNLFTPTQRCPGTPSKVHFLTLFPIHKVTGMFPIGMNRKMEECIHMHQGWMLRAWYLSRVPNYIMLHSQGFKCFYNSISIKAFWLPTKDVIGIIYYLEHTFPSSWVLILECTIVKLTRTAFDTSCLTPLTCNTLSVTLLCATILKYMWQSWIEIEYYSVAYFERITEFDVL